MGIHCEINLFKPSDGVYRPGGVVAGIIKYAVDEDAKFNKIIVSLKGEGNSRIVHRQNVHTHHNNQTQTHVRHQTYYMKETYVDIDNVITGNQEIIVPVGSYEVQFSFQLPPNIPATFKYYNTIGMYDINCKIGYYVRIKFERPGFLTFDKRFKKKIMLVSGVIPRLPMVPSICGESKKLTQFFSSKKSVVTIRANIQSCVISPGGKIMLNYELVNDTNVKIKGVQTKLVEAYKFIITTGFHEIDTSSSVKDTDTKMGSVKKGDTQNMDVEVYVPLHLGSIENSQLLVRNYFLQVAVLLPIPHRDLVLHIPVQIGDVLDGTIGTINIMYTAIENATEATENATEAIEPPPSYWETMKEDKGDKM